MKSFEFLIDEAFAGERLDKYIAAALPEISRSAAANLIEKGQVLVNGLPCAKKQILKINDTVTANIPQPEEYKAAPENIPLNIVFEDSDVIVINKPKGMVVHPAPGHYSGTMVNALLYHCGNTLSGINGVLRPGIVHRIDKNTSGLIIVAKNDFAHSSLTKQLQDHSLKREYYAIVKGNLKDDEGTINAPIGRSEKDRKKMTVTLKSSKEAITHYRVLQRFDGYTFTKCKLQTGRTHQIRVHMAFIGHPVAGDDVYTTVKSKAEQNLQGQCLHAGAITFVHPKSGEVMSFNAPLPDYFEEFLQKIKKAF
ncbi:MAG: RluA family pseudouridine synthase [Oscillospiraceae bacterium]|jgi:23S rRNA pseudouridine1911/1915/1917 synthase|nr:RluA family pseudouridine synthase [Oscillospiraceae bacterium]